jgi:hypothetical protein
MKKTLFALGLLISSLASAQSVPEFIQGRNAVEEQRTLFNAPQVCWVIYGENVEDYSDLFFKIVDEPTSVTVHYQRLDSGELWVHEIGDDGLSCAVYVHDTEQSKSRLVFYYFEE